LGGIAAVGMQRGRATQRVLQPLAGWRRQPETLLAVDAIMADQHVRVDTPAFGIQGVGLGLGQAAGKLDGAQHGLAS
jgi:hypothetical protein